jgi:hypothetical protein
MHILLLLLILFLSSCNGKNRTRENMERVASTLEVINKNLEFINQKQGLISVSSRQVEGVYNIAENRRIQSRISRNILLIDSVMNDNRTRLGNLEKKLQQSRSRISGLEKIVASMQRTLAAKQQEIDSLKTALEQSSLFIAKLSDSLHTVFYLAAPEDSLKKWKIIEKKGSFLGIIGGSNRLTDAFSLERFARFDKTTARRIPIPAGINDFEFISPHNRDSYSIREPAGITPSAKKTPLSYLVVRNPDRFWAASRVLVIQLDD